MTLSKSDMDEIKGALFDLAVVVMLFIFICAMGIIYEIRLLG